LWEGIDAFPWGGWSGEFAVTNGQAIWVSVDTAGQFYSIGELPSSMPSYTLVAGNNTIMVPLNRSDLTSATLVGDDIGASTIAYFNADTQLWEGIDAFPWGGWSGEFATAIGAPLWVSTDVAGTWPSRTSQILQSKSINK